MFKKFSSTTASSNCLIRSPWDIFHTFTFLKTSLNPSEIILQLIDPRERKEGRYQIVHLCPTDVGVTISFFSSLRSWGTSLFNFYGMKMSECADNRREEKEEERERERNIVFMHEHYYYHTFLSFSSS